MKKLFIVKKYVWADNAKQALKNESKQQADDVWVDEDWKKNVSSPKDAIGFYHSEEE
jgi:hypothetical protein